MHRAARKARIAKPQREGTPPLRQRLRKAAGRTGGSKKNETRTMAQQAITLKLAGKSYSLNIDSEKEEMYRLAEREVNSYLAAIKQNNFKNWTDQDYLSMAALKFAIANVDMAAKPRTGRRRPETAGTLRGRDRCLPQRPERINDMQERVTAP